MHVSIYDNKNLKRNKGY